jgi:hypothetical protein
MLQAPSGTRIDRKGVITARLHALDGVEPAAATILLVEDDRATRTFLADNLSADGYELLEADGADDAQWLIETRFPDLAIVDLGLPVLDSLSAFPCKRACFARLDAYSTPLRALSSPRMRSSESATRWPYARSIIFTLVPMTSARSKIETPAARASLANVCRSAYGPRCSIPAALSAGYQSRWRQLPRLM